MGLEVSAFENELAAFHGRKHAVMANSGSSANWLAIAALFNKAEEPLKPGDKVLVPAIAWSTTFAPLVQYGLDLILADCDETWNADLDNNFDPNGIRLVIGCSILGNPADLARLQTIAGVLGAYFVNDDCETLGGRIGGATTGAFGLMVTESFFYSHQVSAIEGGAVLTDDDELAVLCRMLRAHGWTRDVRKPEQFEDEYDFRVFGYNVRPVEMHAAIAREQLKKLPKFIEARIENYALFCRLTENLPIKPQIPNGQMSPFGLPFLVHGDKDVAADKEARAKLVRALRTAGIDCRLPTGGSFTRHAYGAPWRSQATPNADLVHDTGLFLGNAPFDISEKIERAAEVIRETL